MELSIYVLGHLDLQNELMCAFLNSETGLPCKFIPPEKLVEVLDDSSEDRRLVLWDYLDTEPGVLWGAVGYSTYQNRPGCLLALFNVPRGTDLENEMIARGFRGVFYEDTPLEMLAKGVKAIASGKLWFSRESMERYLWSREPLAGAQKSLTPREREILTMIAHGAANTEIADALAISPHTVKTHIYNIYRKIGVPNRLQAALWAVEHFGVRHSKLY